MRNWLQRLHAGLLARFEEKYRPLVAGRKHSLFAEIRGTVLEIGAGTGANLLFLAQQVRLVSIDPNPFMEPYVREAARRQCIRTDFLQARAERLPLRSASMDAVISTLVLCCVKDLAGVLGEILRVLKPGGRFYFIEHVGALPGTKTRRRQDFVCPIWKRVADGCHPNRETWKWIEAAGFESVQYERFTVPLPIAGPHIAGVAAKA